MIWMNRNEVYSILRDEATKIEQRITGEDGRLFQIYLALLALYGAFFVANIAFPLEGNALWLTLLIIGGLWFLCALFWGVWAIFLIRRVPAKELKGIFEEVRGIGLVSSVLFVFSSILVFVSFVAMAIPFFDWRYLLFTVLLVLVSTDKIVTSIALLGKKSFSGTRDIADSFARFLKSRFAIVLQMLGIVSLVMLAVGTFMNVLYYWPSGPLSPNFLAFVIFAEIVTIYFILHIGIIKHSIQVERKRANELKSRLKDLRSNPQADLDLMLRWYNEFIE